MTLPKFTRIKYMRSFWSFTHRPVKLSLNLKGRFPVSKVISGSLGDISNHGGGSVKKSWLCVLSQAGSVTF